MYSEKQIRKIIKKTEKSSIYQVAKECGVAYNTLRGWIKSYEVVPSSNLSNPKSGILEGYLCHCSTKLHFNDMQINDLFLVSIMDTNTGNLIFCVTLKNAAKCKKILTSVQAAHQGCESSKTEFVQEYQNLTKQQANYNFSKIIKPVAEIARKQQTIQDILIAASCQQLLVAQRLGRTPFPLVPFYVDNFSADNLPERIITLESAVSTVLKKYLQENAGSCDLSMFFNNVADLLPFKKLISSDAVEYLNLNQLPDLINRKPQAGIVLKKQEFNQFTAGHNYMISVQYKKIDTGNHKLPVYLLVAYDLKNQFINCCFTYECNKSNKALYLLYLNNFFHSCQIMEVQFLTDLKMDEISSSSCRDFKRIIDSKISNLLKPLKQILKGSEEIPDMLIKSFIFLADHNISLNMADLTHPPFVLEDNISEFDFRDNALMINTLSTNARNTILEVAKEKRNREPGTHEMSVEKLLSIYKFFISQNIESNQLENRILEKAQMMQVMGDLNNSESLLKVLFEHKSLTAAGRNNLYISYGQQLFRSGQYDKACLFYKKAIQGSRKTQQLDTEFNGLMLTATLYLHQRMLDKTYRYLRLAQKVTVRLNEDKYFTKYHFTFASYYYARREYDLALAEYQLSAVHANQANSLNDYTNSISGIANCYLCLNKYKSAIKYAKIALARNLETGLKIPIVISYETCARCYYALKMYDQVEEQISRQLNILKDFNYPILEFNARELHIQQLLAQNKKTEVMIEFEKLKKLVKDIDNQILQKSFIELEKQIREFK